MGNAEYDCMTSNEMTSCVILVVYDFESKIYTLINDEYTSFKMQFSSMEADEIWHSFHL
jgi:hypothetical protein